MYRESLDQNGVLLVAFLLIRLGIFYDQRNKPFRSSYLLKKTEKFSRFCTMQLIPMYQ